MEFSVNSQILYALAIFIICFILVHSTFFLIYSLKKAKQLNLEKKYIVKIISGVILFTIPTAISLLVGIITLSKLLGIPLPWIRLSVIGAITYELPAATATANAASLPLSETISNPSIYVTIFAVMTVGILPSLILPIFMVKKINKGIIKVQKKDNKWGEIFAASMFVGMISAFLGLVFSKVSTGWSGWLPVFVMLVSVITMAICDFLVNKKGFKWLKSYSLTISIVVGLVFAFFVSPLFI